MIGLEWVTRWSRRRQAMRSRFNPYIAGAPILDDHLFFGRERVTLHVLDVLRTKSVMLSGETRIGKTSLLYRLKKALPSAEHAGCRFLPIFIDLQGVPEVAFLHALMSEVMEGLNLSPGHLSLRFTPERTCYDHDDFRLDLQRILEDVRRRNEKKELKLTMLADEVDVLTEYSESLNEHLHDIFSSFSESLVAVMSGVAIKRSWQSEVSPWHGFFDEIELASFTREEAEALVRSPVARVYRYQPAAVARIIELSGSRPYLIQKLCLHAVSRMLEDGRSTIQTGDVETAFEDVSARFQTEGSWVVPR